MRLNPRPFFSLVGFLGWCWDVGFAVDPLSLWRVAMECCLVVSSGLQSVEVDVDSAFWR